MRKFSICLALLMALMMCGSAMASSVTYLDRDELFDFKPGSVYQATDLFENFKELMPGDIREEIITVRNSSKGQVRIWLQCKYDSYVETEAKDFLEQLTLTVEAADRELFEAPANQKAQLSGPVLLGTFRAKGQTELKVTLEVPADLGNQYMGQVGVVPWTFLIEEVPDDDTPETGDWFDAEVWTCVGALIAVMIVCLLLILRKKNARAN